MSQHRRANSHCGFTPARFGFSAALRKTLIALVLSAAATTFAAAPSSAHEYKLGNLEIAHPWSRATPEGAKVAGGYMVIHNDGPAPDRLVSITSEIAAKAEIHEMAVDAAGVMTMRPVEGGIEIPAGREVALKPGTFHIMFMDLKQPAKEGTRFKGTLTFEKAGPVDVEFAVEAMGSAGQHEHMK